MTPRTAAFTFLALPLELRCKIYEELLCLGPWVERYPRNEDKDDKHAGSVSQDEHEDYDEDDKSDQDIVSDNENAEDVTLEEGKDLNNKEGHEVNNALVKIEGRGDAETHRGRPPTDRLRRCGHWLPSELTNSIDPTILRVNKQIHSEAVTILYKSIDCRVNVNRVGRFGLVSQRFFSHDRDVGYDILNFTGTPAEERQPPEAYWWCSYEGSCRIEKIIYVRCFWWVRNIGLDAQWSEIFGGSDFEGWTRGTHPFTPMGTFLLQILRYLNEEPQSNGPISKRLSILIRGGIPIKNSVRDLGLWSLSEDQRSSTLSSHRTNLLFKGTTEIMKLLNSIRRSRSVLVTECLVSGRDLLKASPQEVDIENFPWTQT